MATWRELIGETLAEYGETWADVEHCTLTEPELDKEFHDGFGGEQGKPFAAYTAKRVYFPAMYDGSEWCASVPRHPDGPVDHVGG